MSENTENKAKEVAEKNPATSTATETKTTVLNATQLRQLKAKELRAANAKKAEKAAKILADKKADATAVAEKADKNPKKDTRKIFKDDRGQKFRFKLSAPKTLNVDGVSTSIDDIIEDEEIMLELVNGNSNYLEQIH